VQRSLRHVRVIAVSLAVTGVVGCSSDAGSSSPGAGATAPTTVATPATPQGTAPATAQGATPATAVTAPPRDVESSERFAILDPDWLAADDQFVYVKLDSGKVLRLDPATGETLGTTVIGGELCQGLGAAFGSVWSCRGLVDGDVIVRIDPSTDAVVATVDVTKARMQGNLVGGFDRLWILGANGTQLFPIDPATNTADPPIELGIAGRMDGLDDPYAIDVTADDVWIGMATSTVRVDATSLGIVATIPVGPGHDGSIDVDGTDLWIRNEHQLLVRVDTTTGAELERLSAPIASGGDVLVAAGAVWATAYDDTLLVRHALR
jgi:hypothetical protein